MNDWFTDWLIGWPIQSGCLLSLHQYHHLIVLSEYNTVVSEKRATCRYQISTGSRSVYCTRRVILPSITRDYTSHSSIAYRKQLPPQQAVDGNGRVRYESTSAKKTPWPATTYPQSKKDHQEGHQLDSNQLTTWEGRPTISWRLDSLWWSRSQKKVGVNSTIKKGESGAKWGEPSEVRFALARWHMFMMWKEWTLPAAGRE